MPSSQPLWQSFKALTRYDAASSRSVLHHALHAWSYWHEFSSAKSHRQFCASASALARRALRGWRRWTVQTRLFAPSWQRYRIRPQRLPPLPARKAPARLQPRQPYPISHSAANFGGGSRGHSRNSHGQLTGTIPSRSNDSNDARSGRQPILLVSRSPTSSLPIGRGSGHGRAARPRRSYGTLGSVKGKQS